MSRPLPRISIVTPSYNQARFIGWTARSVFLQRYPNLEYILMDGGSTDGTMDVLAPWLDRFAHVTHERDKGQSDAIHRGFTKCTGDIMAYLNSDDMLAPGALHWVAHFFDENPEVDAVYSHRVTVDGKNKCIWYWILPEHSDWYMSRWDLIPQETCFWRRRIFDKCGNTDPAFRFAMDYDLFVRFMRSGRFRRVNRFLAAFRIHSTSKTSSLLYTIGLQEIAQVHNTYGLRLYSTLIGKAFMVSVQARSALFARRGSVLPGLPPSVGYNLAEVWGERSSVSTAGIGA